MNEDQETKLAQELATLMDSGGTSSTPEILEALETAGFISGALAPDAPPLRAEFDANLRRKLAAETSRTHNKVIPLTHKSWFKMALAAALFVVIVAPSWGYIRHMELRSTYRMKMERLEKYDKMYVPRLDRLRKSLDGGEAAAPGLSEHLNSRREDRIKEITNRWHSSHSESEGRLQ